MQFRGGAINAMRNEIAEVWQAVYFKTAIADLI